MLTLEKLLIVVDMQNDFIDGSLGSAQAQSIVENVREKIAAYTRDHNRIIFTRDTHDENYLQTQEGRNLPITHCVIDSEGWQISSKLHVENALVFDKKSFGSPELARYVQTLSGICEIELVGLCTDICVISNALILKAFLPEAAITVDASCCAGVTPESHRTALAAMKMCQIQIIGE
jgi:nicotinamidase-related amidase